MDKNILTSGLGSESRESPDEWKEIRISRNELSGFEIAESKVLRRITPKGTVIPDCFLFAEFSLTNDCGQIIRDNLGSYGGAYVEVAFTDQAPRRGQLTIPKNFDADDVRNPGYRAELSNGCRITYLDLVNGIKVRKLPLEDWTKNRVNDIL